MKLRDLRPAVSAAFILLLLGSLMIAAAPATAQFPGGFIKKSYDAPNRPRLTASQIQSFVPSTRGKFTFPAPYNTQGVRITIPSDCGGADCIDYVAYSYWKNMNNHQNSDTMYIMLGLNRNRGGAEGPTLFSYNKTTDVVTKVGALFDPSTSWSWASANGWYFSAAQATKLYVYNWHSTAFYRYDVLSHSFEQIFDIASRTDLFGSGRYMTQAHSSDDDKAHSFTVTDTTENPLGCGVYFEASQTFKWFPRTGNFDECHIDASGRWLDINEGSADLDNHVIDLNNNNEVVILNQNGRLGHMDMGFGYAVGNSGSVPVPQAALLYKFPLATTTYPVGPIVFYNVDWNTGIVNHISHQNRKSGVAPEQQYACGSDLDGNPARENEIACFRLDTSYDALFVAPVMTDINAPGGGCDYCKYPKGNLDVTGKYFIWTSNMYGNRIDAFIVKVPSQLLVPDSTTTPPPPPPPPPPSDTTGPVISAVSAPVVSSSGATISWSTDEASDSQVEYGTTTAYGNATSLNSTMVVSHGQNLGSLASNTTYHYRVKSKDSAGNASTSGDFSFTTTASSSGPVGGSAPTVAITSPSAGLSLKGKIRVAATASDSDGIAGVQFQLDGQNLGSEDTVAPYTITWNTGATTNGTHTLTAVARDTLGNMTTSAPVVVTVRGSRLAATSSFSTQNVAWTNVSNASASGNSLQKTSGCDGCSDSGAISVQQIPSGNGYLEFTASETTTNRSIGLSNLNSGTTRADIDYAVMFWGVNGGIVEIYEKDVYKASAGNFVPGDLFRVAVQNGVVSYYKNGALFYTSAQKPSYPLEADVSLWSAGSTIANAVISRTP